MAAWSPEDIKTVLDLADELKGLQQRARGAPPAPRADARDDLPEAVDAHARLLRGRDQPARRPRRSTCAPTTSSSAAARRSRTRRRVLSRYLDAIMIRTYAQDDVEELAEHASVPVINGLTDVAHPCQALADLMTIRERLGRLSGVRVAYLGDGNNVCASLMLGASKFGMRFVAATPAGYEPEETVVKSARRSAVQSGGTVELTHDPRDAARGADVLYTDVWTSMGQDAERERRLERPRRLRDRRRAASGAPRPTRSSSTACRRTTARRSPRTCSTGRSRRCGTRRRTACTRRRRCSR